MPVLLDLILSPSLCTTSQPWLSQCLDSGEVASPPVAPDSHLSAAREECFSIRMGDLLLPLLLLLPAVRSQQLGYGGLPGQRTPRTGMASRWRGHTNESSMKVEHTGETLYDSIRAPTKQH